MAWARRLGPLRLDRHRRRLSPRRRTGRVRMSLARSPVRVLTLIVSNPTSAFGVRSLAGSKVTVQTGPSNSPLTVATTICRRVHWAVECPGSAIHVEASAKAGGGPRAIPEPKANSRMTTAKGAMRGVKGTSLKTPFRGMPPKEQVICPLPILSGPERSPQMRILHDTTNSVFENPLRNPP